MSFPKYPIYEDSDVEWLGEIPTHWAVHRARNLGRFSASGIDKKTVNGEKRVKMFNYLDVYRSQGAPLVGSEALMETTAPRSKITEHSVRRGDILLTPSSETADDIGHAAVVSCVRHPTVYSYHLVRFRPSAQCDSHYLCRWLNSKEARAYFSSVASGTTRMVLSRKDFKDTPIPLPELKEQITIAAFLDHETARIDALIGEQKRLIDLLKEKRQAVISHAVTKGLDPDVQMKNSGVAWLGAIPAHWEVRKLSFDFAAVKGPRGAILTKEYCAANPGLYPVYSGQTDNAGVLGSIDDFDFSLGDDGGLLTTTVGAKAMSINFVKDNLSLSQNCMLIRPRANNIFTKFYFYHLQPLFQLERGMIPDHMQPSFRMEDLYGFYVAQPPRQEQEEIAHTLDVEMGKLDALGVEAGHLIQRLQERRSALISAAVIGKIDVRNWQAPAESETETYPMAAEPEAAYGATRS